MSYILKLKEKGSACAVKKYYHLASNCTLKRVLKELREYVFSLLSSSIAVRLIGRAASINSLIHQGNLRGAMNASPVQDLW